MKFSFEVSGFTEKIEEVKVHISTDDYRPHIMKEVMKERDEGEDEKKE